MKLLEKDSKKKTTKDLVMSAKLIDVLTTISEKSKVLSDFLKRPKILETFEYNYIDLSENDDIITLIREKRLAEIKEEITNWVVIAKKGYKIKSSWFKKLNFIQKEDGSYEERLLPPKGTVGKIANKFPHPDFETYPNKVICRFLTTIDDKVAERISKGEITDEQKKSLKNLIGKPYDFCVSFDNLQEDYNPNDIWKATGRIEMKVGKFFQLLFKSLELEANADTDKEINDLVNSYKATIAILKDQLKLFDIVAGEDIKWGYTRTTYSKNQGTLSQSCMTNQGNGRLDLYVNNPENIRLIVLKDFKDKTKIRGRALLWKSDDNRYYMDRIYTIEPALEGLFIELAKKMGYLTHHDYYKGPRNNIASTDVRGIPKFTVTLKNKFEGCPYLDSMVLAGDRKSVQHGR